MSPERFQVRPVEGSTQGCAHVVDTEKKGKIVSFGGPDKISGNQLFYDSGKAEQAAKLLNSGISPEEINIHKL